MQNTTTQMDGTDMYEDLNSFEEALKHFGTRVDVIIAMEMSRRISPEESYQMIKDELKEVKKCRKQFKKELIQE